MRKYVEVVPKKTLKDAQPGDLLRWPKTAEGEHYVVESITVDRIEFTSSKTGKTTNSPRGWDFGHARVVAIVPEPEVTVAFQNIYKDRGDTGLWCSKGSADYHQSPTRKRLACVKLTFVDGEAVDAELA